MSAFADTMAVTVDDTSAIEKKLDEIVKLIESNVSNERIADCLVGEVRALAERIAVELPGDRPAEGASGDPVSAPEPAPKPKSESPFKAEKPKPKRGK